MRERLRSQQYYRNAVTALSGKRSNTNTPDLDAQTMTKMAHLRRQADVKLQDDFSNSVIQNQLTPAQIKKVLRPTVMQGDYEGCKAILNKFQRDKTAF